LPLWAASTPPAADQAACSCSPKNSSLGFWLKIPFDGIWPFTRPYSFAVDVEMSWEFCSLGVALMTLAYFLLIRRFTAESVFYRRVIRPLSEASYGT